MAKQKEAWDKLSMQEKAQLIKLSVDNGVSSLKQIRDTYNLYSSGGKKQSTVNRPRDIDEAIEISRNTPYNKNIDDVEGPGYREYMWKLAQAKSKVWGISPEEAYDSFIHPSEFNYRRWYNLASQDELDNTLTNGDAHWMDVFGKTVGADTFSNESPYSGYVNPYNPKGITGGTWTGRLGIDEYIPSESQIDNDWPLNKAWFAIDRGNKYYQEKISKGEDTHEVPSIMTYNNGVMLPEITVTPRGNYIEYSPYANGGDLAHKKSGEEQGESSSLNTPYTITGDTIQMSPIPITNGTLTANPIVLDYSDKIHAQTMLDDVNRNKAEEQYTKDYKDYIAQIEAFNKQFLDIFGGFNDKKYKSIFKNTYNTPSEILNSALDDVRSSGQFDTYRFDNRGYTPYLKQVYTDLIQDTKNINNKTRKELSNLLSNFDWDKQSTFGEKAMQLWQTPYSGSVTPQEYFANRALDAMQGYVYTDIYFNSPGFKDRIKNFNQTLLYQNYTPLLMGLTANFLPQHYNANAAGTWGLNTKTNSFAMGAHEGAHHNYVYRGAYTGARPQSQQTESLYYSPYYHNNYSNIPVEILTILKPSNYDNEHDAEINESYSDLVATRAWLEKLGIYKSTEAGQTFTEEMYDRYLNTEEGKNDRFLQLHNKQQVIDALNLIASNTNTTNPFETSNGMYLAAFGGPLSHKKSTGGPLYPFSFEKNPFLKTPVVRYDEGGFFAKLFGKKDASPTPEEIKADRVERFINDTWETEYSVPRGYDPTTGLFYPYKSPEGGTKTIGPGFKLRADGSGDATMFSAKEAAKGVTREQINEKLRAQGELQYDKVLEFLNQKGNRLPVDTINPNIMNGLMDLRFQVGALGGWDNLREAVLNGDLESIKKESLVTFKDGDTGKIKPDVRRNELRAKKFWHYD